MCACACRVNGAPVSTEGIALQVQYAPLTAADVTLHGADVSTLTCGRQHRISLQPIGGGQGGRRFGADEQLRAVVTGAAVH